MAMSYTSLTGNKAVAGSIINWTSYNKLDVGTVVDEAQTLLYTLLRCREMRTSWTFGMVAGQVSQPLPLRFLDPIGRAYDITNNNQYSHTLESEVRDSRAFDNSLAGSLGNNPFTTTAGSSLVTVNLTNHGINQSSTFTALGAVTANGLNLNGAVDVVSVTDANNFVVDASDNNSGATASASGVDGGNAVTYTANNLISSLPTRWSIWDEKIQFDCAFISPAAMKLEYYRAPLLLSASNPTNFVTTRYPTLMRIACLAAAANYMKDDTEYQKQVTALSAFVQTAMAENDLSYRGAEFGTDTP